MPRSGAVALKRVNGKLVSSKSKTGNPACSDAMSRWVRSRHGGAAVGPDVFKLLAKCRQMAAQNKKAELGQAAGKLAPGRGTWQRSEQAAALRARRAEGRRPVETPKPAPAPAPVESAPRRAEAAAKPSTLESYRRKRAAGKALTTKEFTLGLERTRRAVELRSRREGDRPPAPAPKPTAPKAPGRGAAERRDLADDLRVYRALTRSGRPLSRTYLADVRDKVKTLSRERQDRALMRMQMGDDAVLYRLDDPLQITPRHRAAEFRTPSGEERHIAYYGGTSSHTGAYGRIDTLLRERRAKKQSRKTSR